ncbi:MAG: hypothetical protein ACPLZG_12525 [Thermoproteota archaeon]|jgi:hypothetical protein
MNMEGGLSPYTIYQIVFSRQAERFLAPYFREIEPYYEGEKLFLRGIIEVKGRTFAIKIPLDKRLRRLMRELNRLEFPILGGTVKYEDMKTVIMTIYLPLSVLSKVIHIYKGDIRRTTGLPKDEKLRNYMMFKRVVANKMAKGIKVYLGKNKEEK